MVVMIGLTGGLAAGKSTVAARLAAAGIVVVDADELVAELYAPGAPGSRAVQELFGQELLDASGAVDRRRLGERVFGDPEALARLELRIHPLVRKAFEQIAASAATPVVLEGALLVEAGFAPDFDLLVTVEAPEDVRLERAVARGLEPDQARARLAAQATGERRRAAADVVIENTGSVTDLERRSDDLARRILAGEGVQ
jgi:dephospho-CoA kinase